jgi:hypothetical protein
MRATALFLCAIAANAGAQTVEVQLREQHTGAPVVGAVVRLFRDKTEIIQVLTNATGKAVLPGGVAGMYRVRINRIGFRSVTIDSIALAVGQTVKKNVTMSTTPFVLPTVDVQTKAQCGTKLEDGPVVAALWEQIATALRANVLTQTVWQIPLNVQRFKRTVSLEDSVMRDLIVGSYVIHGPPFGAADPAALEKDGFVTQDRDGTMFNAPDAQTILSDAFVATHCFKGVPGDNGLMGLAFEPLKSRRQSDVKGTLWIDKATSELRSLEYVYTNLHGGMERVTLGGRVDFKRLESGAWIVSYWHIRMPKIHVIPADVHFFNGQQITRPEIRDVDYFIEEGGRVTVIDATTTVVTVATLIGVVTDSSSGVHALEGALVKLVGEPDSAFTDFEGRYRLTTKSAGTQMVTVSHPKFGLVPDSSTKEAHLSLGSSARTDFAVPSAATFVRAFCGTADKSGAGIIGRAVNDKDSTGAEGRDIRVNWATGTNMGNARFNEQHAETGPNGIFVVCSLPPNTTFTIGLAKDPRPETHTEFHLGDGEYKWVDVKIFLPPSNR